VTGEMQYLIPTLLCVLCRGELRVYLRDRPLNPLLPMDDSDRDYE
jgi:hypothetical protein